MSISFDNINQQLLARANTLIPTLLPGGKKVGSEWVCSNINGGEGRSFSINLDTGLWADFATGDKGRDIISLYAKQRKTSQTDAALSIQKLAGLSNPQTDLPFFKPMFGVKPTAHWVYRNFQGNPIAAVVRYDLQNNKKTYTQCHFNGRAWVFKTHPDPKPLYNLHLIKKETKNILIVEGEKTAEVAQKIAGNTYVATCWIGGSNAPLAKMDWSPIYGKNILLIPDADTPGRDCMDKVRKILQEHCPTIKTVSTSDMPQGWDLADNPEWTWDTFKTWAKARANTSPEIIPKQLTTPETADLSVVDDACPVSIREQWLDMGIPMAGNKPIINIITASRILQYERTLSENIYYDEFYRNIFINGEPLRDDHEISLTAIIQSRYGISSMTEAVVRSAIIYHARTHIRNEPKQWLTGLKWDGKPRVRSFFHTYMGTPNDEYHQDVSKYFLVSMCARIIEPGCQADSMVVLTGNQGIKKSSSFMALVGKKWFAVNSQKIGKENFISGIQGKILTEIGEMSSIRKAHIEDVKLVTSNRVDRYRVPYDRHTQDLPRICMFAGTTNEDQFLVDDTGNRRFYPICPIACLPDLISRDRDQLFAEALDIYNADRINWWIVTDLAEQHQEHHRLLDPWEEILSEYDVLKFHQIGIDPYQGFKIHDIADKIFKIDSRDLTKTSTIRISSALKKLGFKRAITKNNDRSSTRVWRLEQLPEKVCLPTAPSFDE